VPNSAMPVTSVEAAWETVLRVCPPDIQSRIQALSKSVLEQIEEIRFRLAQPLQLCGASFDAFLHREQGLTEDVQQGLVVGTEHLSRVIQAVTQSSLYAVEDELKRGYVTMPGGHRVGIGGRAVLYESGAVRSIRSITSLNVRIAKERIGAASALLPFVYHKTSGKPLNILIISPPQCGKTTILRELTRSWSEGLVGSVRRGMKVTVVDERSEIAGCVEGVAQFRLGPRTDVLDACPKAEGMLMAIRSLSPDIVVTDEIGRQQDRDAVLEATHAGVKVLATAHASGLEEWRDRPFMKELYDAKAFDRYVVLSRRSGPGTIEQILDAQGRGQGGFTAHGKRLDAP
jgi:stage III sporulation protein AA